LRPGMKQPNEAGLPIDGSGVPGEETLGDAEPFSRVGSSRTEPTGSSVSAEPARVPELKAIVLGPPGSGKSSFIAALESSLIANPSNLVRRCTDNSGSTPEGEIPNGGPAEAFWERGAKSFYIELAQSPHRGVNLKLYESRGEGCSEGPTNPGHSSTWLAQARHAHLLVLCVDARDGQRAYWQSMVEHLVRDLTSLEEAPGAKDSEAELQGIIPSLSPGRTYCLPFRRVLFLLSRVDLLFERALESQNGYGFLQLIAAQEPSQLARALDPAPQLCSLLGTLIVGKVLHAVQEKAEVAVVATSSRGMGSTLRDFHGGDGLTDWRPLGIKEALEFLVTGLCTAPVAPLSRSVLGRNHFVQLL